MKLAKEVLMADQTGVIRLDLVYLQNGLRSRQDQPPGLGIDMTWGLEVKIPSPDRKSIKVFSTTERGEIFFLV